MNDGVGIRVKENVAWDKNRDSDKMQMPSGGWCRGLGVIWRLWRLWHLWCRFVPSSVLSSHLGVCLGQVIRGLSLGVYLGGGKNHRKKNSPPSKVCERVSARAVSLQEIEQAGASHRASPISFLGVRSLLKSTLLRGHCYVIALGNGQPRGLMGTSCIHGSHAVCFFVVRALLWGGVQGRCRCSSRCWRRRRISRVHLVQ